jgi:hypothetical protein
MTMKIEGLKDLEKALGDMEENHPKAFAAALWQNGQELHRFSVQKTPVNTGHLRRSYVVDRPDISGNTITVLVGFSAQYALWVHEINKNYSKGDWKFLERAVDEASSGWEKRLAKRTKKLIDRKFFKVPDEDSGADFDRGDFGE